MDKNQTHAICTVFLTNVHNGIQLRYMSGMEFCVVFPGGDYHNKIVSQNSAIHFPFKLW